MKYTAKEQVFRIHYYDLKHKNGVDTGWFSTSEGIDSVRKRLYRYLNGFEDQDLDRVVHILKYQSDKSLKLVGIAYRPHREILWESVGNKTVYRVLPSGRLEATDLKPRRGRK